MKSGRHAVQHITVTAAQDGQRLDNWLMGRLKGVPKSHVYRLLRTGQVRVNRKRARPGTRVACEDVIRLPPVRRPDGDHRATPSGQLQARLARAIVYESDRVLVLDKPAGLAVHGGSGVAFGLIEALNAMRPRDELKLVHRLDRATSGCLVVAKTREAVETLNGQLRAGAVTKQYLALVRGHWDAGRRQVDARLMRTRQGGERVTRVGADGRPALTRFRRVGPCGPDSLVRAEPVTGRTHQIRVHAAHADHPIAGDTRYGQRAFNRRLRKLGLKRLFLHAQRIAFELPGGEMVDVSVPLPEELRAVLDRLESTPATSG